MIEKGTKKADGALRPDSAFHCMIQYKSQATEPHTLIFKSSVSQVSTGESTLEHG